MFYLLKVMTVALESVLIEMGQFERCATVCRAPRNALMNLLSNGCDLAVFLNASRFANHTVILLDNYCCIINCSL